MYYGYIELSKFAGAEIHEREVDGKVERCISIPIRINGFAENNSKSEYGRRIFFNFIANDMRPNPNNFSHYISLYSRDKKVVEDINKYGHYESLRFLGKLRPGVSNSHFYKKTSIDDAMKTD